MFTIAEVLVEGNHYRVKIVKDGLSSSVAITETAIEYLLAHFIVDNVNQLEKCSFDSNQTTPAAGFLAFLIQLFSDDILV